MLKKNISYIILLIAGILGFGNTLNHEYVLDDNAIITNHQHVQSGFDGIDEIFTTNYLHGLNQFNDGLYRPISPMSFAIEHEISPGSKINHFFNIVYALITALVMFFVLMRVFSLPEYLSLGGALLFLLLPVHTEVIANVKSRDELLALLFTLSSLYFLFQYVKTSVVKHLITGSFLFTLALLSKESAFTFVGIVPVILFWLNQSRKKEVYVVAGITAGLGLVFLIIRHNVLGSMPNEVDEGTLSALNNSILATDKTLEKWGTALWLQSLYLFKTLIPYSLQHDYSFNQIEIVSLFSIKAFSGILILLSGAFGCWYFRTKAPLISIGLVWYFGALSVVSNLVFPIGATFAERFIYAPSFGIILAIIGSLSYYQQINGRFQVRSFWIVTGLVLLIMGTITFQRNKDWKNNYTLFSADYPKLTNSARGNYNYASACREKAATTGKQVEKTKLLKESITAFGKAIEIYPTYWDAYNNLSIAYKEIGNFDQSIKVLQELLRQNSTYQKGWFNLGVNQYQKKNYKEALNAFLQYNQLNGSNQSSWYYCGLSAGFMNDFKKATEYLDRCLQLNPNHKEALLFNGKAYGFLKEYDKSEAYFRRVLQLEPNNGDAKQNLEITLSLKKKNL